MTIKCVKCGTATAPNWITIQYSDSAEDETKTFVFCPQCYEQEAINGI